VHRLGNSLRNKTIDELMTLYASQWKKPRPRRRTTKTTTFDRNPLVILIAKRRASFKCEVADCTIPAFLAADDHTSKPIT
jgi:hypothetical protein